MGITWSRVGITWIGFRKRRKEWGGGEGFTLFLMFGLFFYFFLDSPFFNFFPLYFSLRNHGSSFQLTHLLSGKCKQIEKQECDSWDKLFYLFFSRNWFQKLRATCVPSAMNLWPSTRVYPETELIRASLESSLGRTHSPIQLHQQACLAVVEKF